MRKKSSGITELEALVINKRFKMTAPLEETGVCRRAVQNYMTRHLNGDASRTMVA